MTVAILVLAVLVFLVSCILIGGWARISSDPRITHLGLLAWSLVLALLAVPLLILSIIHIVTT